MVERIRLKKGKEGMTFRFEKHDVFGERRKGILESTR